MLVTLSLALNTQSITNTVRHCACRLKCSLITYRRCLCETMRKKECTVSYCPNTYHIWQLRVPRANRLLSTVCPWLHEIMLTSAVVSKQHWMMEEAEGEETKREDRRGGYLNELIQWTKDVRSIQNSNNLGCPYSEKEEKGDEINRQKDGNGVKKNNQINKVRTR